MELERRQRGVVKTMIKCALDVLKNPKNSNIVDRMRGVHELTNHTMACKISGRVIVI